MLEHIREAGMSVSKNRQIKKSKAHLERCPIDESHLFIILVKFYTKIKKKNKQKECREGN